MIYGLGVLAVFAYFTRVLAAKRETGIVEPVDAVETESLEIGLITACQRVRATQIEMLLSLVTLASRETGWIDTGVAAGLLRDKFGYGQHVISSSS